MERSTISDAGRCFRRQQAEAVPHFSFLIPCYADAGDVAAIAKIGRCLYSIEQQTDPHWEVVLVSDGPNEMIRDTYIAFREEARKIGRDKWVKYLSAPYVGKPGGHYSVECGKDICEGEFLTVLNGDNTLRPNYVADMYNSDADFLFCAVKMNDDPGIILSGRGRSRGRIDRLNYSIRTGIAKQVRHRMHTDADYDWIVECMAYRRQTAEVREHFTELVLGEHN